MNVASHRLLEIRKFNTTISPTKIKELNKKVSRRKEKKSDDNLIYKSHKRTESNSNLSDTNSDVSIKIIPRRENILLCEYLLCNGNKMLLEGDFISEIRKIVYDENKDENEQYNIKTYTHNKTPYIYRPDTKARSIYNIFLLLLNLMSLIEFPFIIGFDIELDTHWIDIKIMSCLIYLVDIALTFRTGYYDKRFIFITDPEKILFNYIKGMFLIDFLTVLPFDILFESSGIFHSHNSDSWKMLKLIYLIQVLRLFKLNKLFNSICDVYGLSVMTRRVFELLFALIYISHCSGCLFYYFSTFEEYYMHWTNTDKFKGAKLYELYIAALYWSITTITTSGYGDIVGENDLERLASIIITMIGCIVFANVIGGISESVKKLQFKSDIDSEKTEQISSYLDEQNTPENMSNRVMKQYIYYFRVKISNDEYKIINELPEYLSDEIMISIYKEILSKIQLFDYINDNCILAYYLSLMNVFIFYYSQYFYHQEIIYFIQMIYLIHYIL